MVNHPIGSLVRVHQKYESVQVHIMTDNGLQHADGRFLNRFHYPELFRAIGYKYGRYRDDFKLPNTCGSWGGLTTVPPSPHTHTVVGFDPAFGNHTHGYFVGPTPSTIYKKHKLDRNDVLGRVEEVAEDLFGVKVNMTLDTNAFADAIKKYQDYCASPIVKATEVRHMFGLDQPKTDMDLFPEMHGVKGMTWGVQRSSGRYPFSNSNLKENNMANATVKLKTPTKNIKRKDLSVALRLGQLARNEDALFDVIALVQSIGDDEKIYRVNEIKGRDQVVGKNVRLHATDASGVCSDFVEDGYSGALNFVIDGKLEKVDGSDFVIVSDISEPDAPIGNDTLRMVQD